MLKTSARETRFMFLNGDREEEISVEVCVLDPYDWL